MTLIYDKRVSRYLLKRKPSRFQYGMLRVRFSTWYIYTAYNTILLGYHRKAEEELKYRFYKLQSEIDEVPIVGHAFDNRLFEC